MAVPKGGLDLGSWSIPLLADFPIGPGLSESLQWVASSLETFDWIGQTLHSRNTAGSSGYWNPPWPEFLTAFVGVEFAIGADTHYGWIRVEVFAPPGNGGTIMDWAYNSIPGQPILAGQVPEPSTWALFAGGCLAFFAFGRLRRLK